MKILRLTSKNVKRLRAVEIAPDGNVVVIGGRNAQGKTSVLDSILYALGGKEVACREPVRRGAERAEVRCDLGDLIVTRTFTATGGGNLTVENKEGERLGSPQRKLDDLVGRLSFDPLAFSRMDSKSQAETLRSLVGLDFATLDGQRAALFEARTEVNREGKALRARFDAIPAVEPDTPETEVSSAEVLKELDAAQALNAIHATERQYVADAENGLKNAETALRVATSQADQTREEIARLQRRLAQEEAATARAKKDCDDARYTTEESRRKAATLVDIDLAPIKARLASNDDTNRKVREKRARATLEKDLEDKRAESAALTAEIEAIDARKQEAVASAKFPVEGLGFDFADGGVTFGGLPFDQASSAEQLRVSVAIGLALNPTLRVLLIRDGSLLDEFSLAMIAEMAEKHDGQLWIEQVSADGATVVIEDGSVVGAPEAVSP